jgi:hypothetical protein
MRQLLVLALIAWACSIATGQAQQSPTVKEINVNGTTLVYQEQGHGAPVVFVHGSPGDHRSWDGQREGIARTHRFIAVDLPTLALHPGRHEVFDGDPC